MRRSRLGAAQRGVARRQLHGLIELARRLRGVVLPGVRDAHVGVERGVVGVPRQRRLAHGDGVVVALGVVVEGAQVLRGGLVIGAQLDGALVKLLGGALVPHLLGRHALVVEGVGVIRVLLEGGVERLLGGGQVVRLERLDARLHLRALSRRRRGDRPGHPRGLRRQSAGRAATTPAYPGWRHRTRRAPALRVSHFACSSSHRTSTVIPSAAKDPSRMALRTTPARHAGPRWRRRWRPART